MKKAVLLLIMLLVLVGCSEGIALKGQTSFKKFGNVLSEKEVFPLKKETPDYFTLGKNPESGLYIVNNETSMLVYLNKFRELPGGYVPPDLVVPDVLHYAPAGDNRRLLREEAAQALESLFEAAKNENITLVAVSGYRTYERQQTIYQSNVASKGQEHADQYSAKPGTSEHQTGLAMDVTVQGNEEVLLEQSFGETEAGEYIENNAHRYGFIIRYPEGKEQITGYSYEPWHLRYVGIEPARTMYTKDITLEEYFGFDYAGNER